MVAGEFDCSNEGHRVGEVPSLLGTRCKRSATFHDLLLNAIVERKPIVNTTAINTLPKIHVSNPCHCGVDPYG